MDRLSCYIDFITWVRGQHSGIRRPRVCEIAISVDVCAALYILHLGPYQALGNRLLGPLEFSIVQHNEDRKYGGGYQHEDGNGYQHLEQRAALFTAQKYKVANRCSTLQQPSSPVLCSSVGDALAKQ